MSKILVITEKLSQVNEIALAIFNNAKKKEGERKGNFFVLRELNGHILRALEPKERITNKNLYNYNSIPFDDSIKYIKKEIIENKKYIYNDIYKLIKNGNFDLIVGYTDPDREGSNIFWELIERIGTNIEIKRFMPSVKDPEYLKESFMKKFADIDLDKRLYLAGEGRLFLDYHFGHNNSVLFSLKMKDNVPVGRVKLGILSILNKREQDRYNYIKNYGDFRNYYGIKGIFVKGDSKYSGNLYKEGKEYDKNNINNIFNEINNIGKGIIKKIEKNNKEYFGGKMFNASGLQKECSKKFGWDAMKTADLLNHLYNENKLCSYPRSSKEVLFEDDKGYIKKQYDKFKEIFKLNYNWSGGGKGTFTSEILEHYGIYPFADKNYKENILNNHGKFNPSDLINLYLLLISRLFKVFGDPKKTSEIEIQTDIGGKYIFNTKSIEVLDWGFQKIEKDISELLGIKKQILKKGKNEDNIEENDDDLKNTHLLKIGDVVNINNLSIIENKENPPDFIKTSGDLVEICSKPKQFLAETEKNSDVIRFFPENGIGTPATLPKIINDMEKNLLIGIVNNHYEILKKGKDLINILPEKFKSILFTAEMEKNLEEIVEGKQKYEDYIEKVYNEIKEDVIKNKNNIKELEKTIGLPCPKCGNGELVKIYSSKNKKTYVVCNKGKNICDFIKEWDDKKNIIKENNFFGAEKFSEKCPNCSSELLENNKTVFCSKKCGFVLWKEKNGKILNKSIIKELIKNGETKGKIEGFVSKLGNKFSAYLKINKKTGNIEFDFNKK